jgi:hypothetical protein
MFSCRPPSRRVECDGRARCGAATAVGRLPGFSGEQAERRTPHLKRRLAGAEHGGERLDIEAPSQSFGAAFVAFQESFWLEFLRPTLTPVGKQKPHKTGD